MNEKDNYQELLKFIVKECNNPSLLKIDEIVDCYKNKKTITNTIYNTKIPNKRVSYFYIVDFFISIDTEYKKVFDKINLKKSYNFDTAVNKTSELTDHLFIDTNYNLNKQIIIETVKNLFALMFQQYLLNKSKKYITNVKFYNNLRIKKINKRLNNTSNKTTLIKLYKEKKNTASDINNCINTQKINCKKMLETTLNDDYIFLYSNLIAEGLYNDIKTNRKNISKIKYLIDLVNNEHNSFLQDLEILNILGLNNYYKLDYVDYDLTNNYMFATGIIKKASIILVAFIVFKSFIIPKSSQTLQSSKKEKIVTENATYINLVDVKPNINNLEKEEDIIALQNIPFISQKDSQIYNGCEAAALLMALQYKNKLLDYNLEKMVQEMPKHENDPHKGFIYSIYDYEPVNVAHWIAPDALAKFGSNYSETIDISQTPVDDLKYYIANDMPVIVYVTAKFDEPIVSNQEVPVNLHVVLLTGYNAKTGEYIILDPYFGRMVVNKNKFENSYNYLKYAVAVK